MVINDGLLVVVKGNPPVVMFEAMNEVLPPSMVHSKVEGMSVSANIF